MNRKLSIAAMLIGGLSILGQLNGLDLPSVSWFFSVGVTFGWIASILLISGGLAGLLFLPKEIRWTPVTLQRFRRFRSIRRGWWSFCILMGLAGIALLDQVLVGKRAWNVALNKAETQLWVVNGMSDDVTVVDVLAAKPIKSVPVGRVPYGVVVVE